MQQNQRSLPYMTLPVSIGVSLILAMLSCIAPWRSVKAQITPDTTLGNNNSVVVPDNLNGNPIDRINGGAIQGSNLFHSFREFNVGEGARAYFTNPGGINNILTRVTGNQASNILGTLGVLGNANLFLINPQGIVFGPNARLDMGGSFVASSADSILFDNGFEFSATNPQTPLLTVNIPVALQLRQNPASIVNQSTAVLALLPGNTLGLIGGNVVLDGSSLQLSGGRIELGGLTGAGTVGLNIQESQGFPTLTSLSFPNGVERADISLSKEAVVNVAAGGGGSIVLNGRNVNIVEGSRLLAGISPGLGSLGTQAGNIEIYATGRVVFDGVSNSIISGAFNQVGENAVGDSGGIEINGRSVEVINGAQLSATTLGKGDSGLIRVTATDKVVFDGQSPLGFRSSAISQVFTGAEGNSGGIEIKAGSVEIINGALLDTNALGKGDSGTIRINARNQVLFDGQSPFGFLSAAFSQVKEGAEGNSGGIVISGDTVRVTNGAQLSATTLGKGDSGLIRITGTDKVVFDGQSPSGSLSTAISQVLTGAQGNSAGIEINADAVIITNGAFLNASTLGKGNAGAIRITGREQVVFDGESSNGNGSAAISQVTSQGVGNSGGIEINAGTLAVTKGAQLTTTTLGTGNSGIIQITATNGIIFDGESRNASRTSAAISQVAENATGNSEGIKINTSTLTLTNGSLLDTSTLGKGNAGRIEINARGRVVFDGESSRGIGSSANSQVATGSEGQAGGIEINADSLEVSRGAQLNTTTLGKGNSGAIQITATNGVVFDGTSSNGFRSSAANSEVKFGAEGDSQGLKISTSSLRITNSAFLSANTNGQGFAGNIEVTANTIELSRAGQIRTNTSASSEAGNITLNAQNHISLTDFNTAVLAQTENTSTSTGGNIFVIGSPRNVLIQNGAELSVNSRGSGAGGDISIQANSLTLTQGEISAETAKERGGNIRLQIADLLLMQRDSRVTTNAGTQSQPEAIGSGGNIGINTQFLVARPSQPSGSDITANATYGDGGRVNITATGIFGIEFRDQPQALLNDITASSEFGGNPGVVNINQPIDPSQNLVELPTTVIDPNDQIAQNPCSQGVGSEFSITGRGGLPPSPNEDLSREATQVGLVEPVSTVGGVKLQPNISSTHDSPSRSSNQIVPAQGWVFNNQGEVVLTAYNPQILPIHRPPKSLGRAC